jgi:hypothetical protein
MLHIVMEGRSSKHPNFYPAIEERQYLTTSTIGPCRPDLVSFLGLVGNMELSFLVT